MNFSNQQQINQLLKIENIDLTFIASSAQVSEQTILKMLCVFYINYQDIVKITDQAITSGDFSLFRQKMHNIKPFMSIMKDTDLVNDISHLQMQLLSNELTTTDQIAQRISKRLADWINITKQISALTT